MIDKTEPEKCAWCNKAITGTPVMPIVRIGGGAARKIDSVTRKVVACPKCADRVRQRSLK